MKRIICAAAAALAVLLVLSTPEARAGSITAELDRTTADDMLVIAVSDTGPGIARENLANIFKPFTQLEQGSTRSKGGMGLGLSLAQRMANVLGGEVSVVSELGAGSTFTLRTPLRVKTHHNVRAAA